MAPNGAGKVFFRLIQTLPTFWAERIWILSIFIFDIFWNLWISRSQISKIWPLAGLGPCLNHLDLLEHSSAVAPRHSRTTKCGRSKELGQYRENPISASPVWGNILNKQNIWQCAIKYGVIQRLGTHGDYVGTFDPSISLYPGISHSPTCCRRRLFLRKMALIFFEVPHV